MGENDGATAAGRGARHDPVPAGAAEAAAAAALIGLTIPAACLPGVLVNLALLGRHAAVLDDGAPAAR